MKKYKIKRVNIPQGGVKHRRTPLYSAGIVSDTQGRIIFRRTTIYGAGRNNIPQGSFQTAQEALKSRREVSKLRRKGIRQRRRLKSPAGRA